MSTALMALNTHLTTPGKDLDAYVQTVKSIPMLSAEEERELAERYYKEDDLDAARQLVLSHMRFVLYVVNGYQGYGLSQADLIQEGNVGLMKAVKRFDPGVGVRLASFAVHWIRAEIHEYIIRNWRIVKVVTTKAQRKLFFNLRSSKKRLGWLNKQEIDTVAKELGVSAKDVVEMEKRLSAKDMAFDAPADAEDDDAAAFSPSAYLEDNRYDPAALIEESEWELHNNDQLSKAFAKLDARSQDILQQRWLDEDKATLQDLADKYEVSAERIRQIEKEAFKKMKKQIKLAV